MCSSFIYNIGIINYRIITEKNKFSFNEKVTAALYDQQD